jgi:hypothetical protein
MSNIPLSSAEIDAAWLNEVLSPEVRDGGTVTGVSAEIIGEGVGFLGELARLTLTYDGAGPNAVTSVISKVPTTNPGFRHIGTMFDFYRKEYGFYDQVAHRVTINVPIAHVNMGDLETNDFILVMEDLGDHRAGNQLEGCCREDAELALRELAKFHASWWEHPELESFSDWLPSNGHPIFEILEHGYRDALPKLEPVAGHLISDTVLQFAHGNRDAYHENLERGAMRRPHTFVHGDFRLDNMMFRDHADGTEFTLIDWQLPFKANPMWDVVYFLAGNFDPDFRRNHEKELLGTYHDTLLANGVTDYCFDQLWDDYRAVSAVLVGYMVTICGDLDWDSLNDRGKEAAEMMISRYSLAIDDLDPGEFLA